MIGIGLSGDKIINNIFQGEILITFATHGNLLTASIVGFYFNLIQRTMRMRTLIINIKTS